MVLGHVSHTNSEYLEMVEDRFKISPGGIMNCGGIFIRPSPTLDVLCLQAYCHGTLPLAHNSWELGLNILALTEKTSVTQLAHREIYKN